MIHLYAYDDNVHCSTTTCQADARNRSVQDACTACVLDAGEQVGPVFHQQNVYYMFVTTLIGLNTVDGPLRVWGVPHVAMALTGGRCLHVALKAHARADMTQKKTYSNDGYNISRLRHAPGHGP